MIKCNMCGISAHEMTCGWGSHMVNGGTIIHTCPKCGLPPVEAVFNGLSGSGTALKKQFDNKAYKGIPPYALTLKLAVASTGVPESMYLEYAEKLYPLFNDPNITTFLPLPAGHYLLKNKAYCEAYNLTYEGE